MIPTSLRSSLRQMRRTPGTSLLIVLTLAFGIGITTAAFSVVHGAVLRPLTYHAPEQLVAVQSAFLRAGLEGMGLSGPEAHELAQFDSGLSSVGAFAFRGGATVAAREPVQASVALVTPSLLATLGVPPSRGRAFDEETVTGALLLHPFWVRAFGADPAVVGRTVTINGTPHEILGIMPAGFDLLDFDVDLLMRLPATDLSGGGRTNHSFSVIGRMAPGLALASAQARLDTVVGAWLDRLPSSHAPSPAMHPLRLVPLQTVVAGSARPMLLTLMGAVALVMLIACVNVANLLLARAERQRHDTAIHLALGAPRGVLVRRWLSEGLIWSFAAAALGTLFAWTLVRTIVSFEPEGIPRLSDLGVDATALFFAATTATVTGVLFGLLPGLRLASARPSQALGSGRSGSAGAGRQLVRHALISIEVVLAVVLLTGSILMIRSFVRLTGVDPGFNTANTWRMSVTYPTRLYPETAHFASALDDLRQRLAASPSVSGVGMMSGLLPRREPNRSTYRVEGAEVDPQGGATLVDFVQICDAGFFDVLGVRLLEGRALAPSDTAASLPVVVINEALARRFFPGESPLGRRITAGGGAAPTRPWLTVVGVVADMHQAGLQTSPGTEVYVPLTQAQSSVGYLPRSLNVVVRSTSASADVASTMRAAVRASAPEVPALGVRTMEEVVWRTVAHPRFLTYLLGGFAFGGLLLAVTGIYSVVSYLVGLRTREIGIRVALGASSGAVRRIVIAQTMGVALLGTVAGLVVSQWASRLLSTVLFDVRPGDVVANLVAATILTLCAAIAADIPARRAAKVDPVDALRD